MLDSIRVDQDEPTNAEPAQLLNNPAAGPGTANDSHGQASKKGNGAGAKRLGGAYLICRHLNDALVVVEEEESSPATAMRSMGRIEPPAR